MRFAASSRDQRPGSLATTVSTPPPPSALGFSQPLDGLHPSHASRVYFAPLARPGFALQGLSLSRSRLDSSPSTCPLVVTRRAPLVAERTASGPPTGPCSPREPVASDPRLSEPSARSPPGLSPPQGFLRLGRGSRFHDPPLTSFCNAPYGTCAAGPSGCYRTEGWDRLSRDDQPSRGSRPCRNLTCSEAAQVGLIASPQECYAVAGAPCSLFDLRNALPAGAT